MTLICCPSGKNYAQKKKRANRVSVQLYWTKNKSSCLTKISKKGIKYVIFDFFLNKPTDAAGWERLDPPPRWPPLCRGVAAALSAFTSQQQPPHHIQNASLKPHVYAHRSARTVRNLARAEAYFVLYCLAEGLREKKSRQSYLAHDGR